MKTSFSPEHVRSFLQTVDGADCDSLVGLKEGQVSQAFAYATDTGEQKVLRLADHRGDFDADIYASRVFGDQLLVPPVNHVDIYEDLSYYCISERAPGVTTDSLSDLELSKIQPAISASLSDIFHFDISETIGYGRISTATGDGAYDSWKSTLAKNLSSSTLESLMVNASNIGIDPMLIKTFYYQYNANLDFASEQRRLLHGDPVFDNMLVSDGIVTANIDWAQAAYGDWVGDYSKLGFWGPGRYENIQTFAAEYNLEADYLDERVALHVAINALSAVVYADRSNNTMIATWLRNHLHEKVDNT